MMISWDLAPFLVICANCDNCIETKSSLKMNRNAKHQNLQLKGGKKKGLNFFVIEGEKKRVKFYD